jgi:hypothetical protein
MQAFSNNEQARANAVQDEILAITTKLEEEDKDQGD